MIALSISIMSIAGTIPVYVLSRLLEWGLFKRIVDKPELGISLSVVFAAIASVGLYGFGSANGGPWNPVPGGIAYVVAGAIVLPLRLRAHRLKEEKAQLAETFE